MAKQKKENFTKTLLDDVLSADKGKRVILFDAKQPGLALQVTHNGTKTFQFRHWDSVRRKTQILTIGKYSGQPKSIKQARDKAAEFLSELNKGIDIAEAAKQFKDEDTFADLFDRWITGSGRMKRTRTGMALRSKKNVDDDRRRYKLYVEGPLGNKRISWFTADRIRKWHAKIITMPKQRGGGTIAPATANQAFSLVRRVFNAMMPEKTNPCTGVVKFQEQARDRFLQPDELRQFFEALYHDDTPELLRDYVLISLFTGARRSNVLSMRWSEISWDRLVWTVPAAKSKNDEAMDIPIVGDAVGILQHRKRTSNSVFVFPGRGKTGHYGEPKRAWKTMLQRAGLTDVRLHDLRRTMGSYQTMTGTSTAIVGKTLGHKSSAATAVYARLNLDPVRASMETAVEAMLATRELSEKVVSIGGDK